MLLVTAYFPMDFSNFSRDLPRINIKTEEGYFRRFSYLAKFKHNMVIFTFKRFKEKILQYRQEYNTKIIYLDNRDMNKWYNLFYKYMVLTNTQSKVIPSKRNMYEYVSPMYCTIVNSKAFFIKYVCNSKLFPEEDIVAWIDFGCFYDDVNIDKIDYPFPKDKISLFSIPEREFNSIKDIICENKPFINGQTIIVPRHMGNLFFKEYKLNLNNLIIREKLISDDEDSMCYMVMNKRNLYNLIPSVREGMGLVYFIESFKYR